MATSLNGSCPFSRSIFPVFSLKLVASLVAVPAQAVGHHAVLRWVCAVLEEDSGSVSGFSLWVFPGERLAVLCHIGVSEAPAPYSLRELLIFSVPKKQPNSHNEKRGASVTASCTPPLFSIAAHGQALRAPRVFAGTSAIVTYTVPAFPQRESACGLGGAVTPLLWVNGA